MITDEQAALFAATLYMCVVRATGGRPDNAALSTTRFATAFADWLAQRQDPRR